MHRRFTPPSAPYYKGQRWVPHLLAWVDLRGTYPTPTAAQDALPADGAARVVAVVWNGRALVDHPLPPAATGAAHRNTTS